MMDALLIWFIAFVVGTTLLAVAIFALALIHRVFRRWLFRRIKAFWRSLD